MTDSYPQMQRRHRDLLHRRGRRFSRYHASTDEPWYVPQPRTSLPVFTTSTRPAPFLEDVAKSPRTLLRAHHRRHQLRRRKPPPARAQPEHLLAIQMVHRGTTPLPLPTPPPVYSSSHIHLHLHRIIPPQQTPTPLPSPRGPAGTNNKH